jgi:hypothetical protein
MDNYLAKILFVDDDNFLRKVYQTELSERNYQVILASDGLEGLEKAQLEDPDLIILDMMMPKKNGFEFDGSDNSSHGRLSDMVLKLKPKSKTSTSLSYSKSGGSDKHNMYVDIPHAYYSDIVENNKDIILTKKNYSNYTEIMH